MAAVEGLRPGASADGWGRCASNDERPFTAADMCTGICCALMRSAAASC
jgi:hypothetical protein